MMNQNETDAEKLERQQQAIADLRLDRDDDDETQRSVVVEAARRATQYSWPGMPEDDRNRLVEMVVGLHALNFQLSIFRRGWSQGVNAERIQLDPEIAGPRILVRAYATAEADAWRMRAEAGELPGDTGPRPSLEDRIRRYLRPHELNGDN